MHPRGALRKFSDAEYEYESSPCVRVNLRRNETDGASRSRPPLVRRASLDCGATRDEMFALHRDLAGSQLMEHGVFRDESPNDEAVLALAVGMVLAGCLCQVPHELMNTRDKGCGDLVSIVEYLFGLVLSAPWAFRSSGFGVKPRHHALLALLSVSYAFFTNLSLASKVPTTVFVALKNGTLAANLVVGVVVLRKRYTLAQYGAVAVVSLGLASTAVRARSLLTTASRAAKDGSAGYLVGVACLIAALLARATSGAVQEWAMRLGGCAAPVSEMIFMRNALGLPFFVVRASGVGIHLRRWLTDPNLKSQWLFLGLNVLFDYCCKILMTKIIARRGALTASLVLSFQKFVAFTISVVFVNPILRNSRTIWWSALCVLLGTVAYSAAATKKGPIKKRD
ncbi:hypothetical protein CTAYLR_002063 [Chrysophaeum taylorii]|uniref:Uncharacterized protein n=1 Tax=Chrysophaeum taylorii TaxID=2483200 RepID=A0AAD7XRB4_9STRA|nr:hypothetical protein CTAYLR_002063 [Chrysophaeum taylorii]